MEDEKVASILQKMKKSSRWLSGFLESYRPPLDGEVYLTDKEVADLLRVSRRTLQEYRNERLLPYIILGGKALYPESDCVRCWKRTIGNLSDNLRKSKNGQPNDGCPFLLAFVPFSAMSSFGYRHKQHIGILLLFGVRFP